MNTWWVIQVDRGREKEGGEKKGRQVWQGTDVSCCHPDIHLKTEMRGECEGDDREEQVEFPEGSSKARKKQTKRRKTLYTKGWGYKRGESRRATKREQGRTENKNGTL